MVSPECFTPSCQFKQKDTARQLLYLGNVRKVALKKRFQFSDTNRETNMLVLSRKLGEKIVIGDNIVVTVVKIDRNQIRIGIEAPTDVPVYREEIAPQRTSLAREARGHSVALTG
jgi:carbon storage regulator